MRKIDFIGNRKIFGMVSLILFVGSIVLIQVKGVKKNVDFAGGTQVMVTFADSSIKTKTIRDLVEPIDKKATVYHNEDDTSASFTIKIKSPEVEKGKEAEASLERLHKLEAGFASINNDEKKLLDFVNTLPEEKVVQSLVIGNILGVTGTDTDIESAYKDIYSKMKEQLAGSNTIGELAGKVAPENAAKMEQALRLAFPSVNRVTRDLFNATLIKFNPLNRDLSADYLDIADQIVAYREGHDDFVTDMNDLTASLKVQEGEDAEKLNDFLKGHFTLGSYNITSNSTFSPSIAAELLSKAWEAILFAIIGILIYISMRFTMGYAVASVVALIHDVVIALGAFSLVGAELSNPVVAAFLTIVGYSLNDTIVVFDRIRENIRNHRKAELPVVMNNSINQTLSRTLVTSLTTFMVVIVIYFGANVTLKDFAFPLLIGIIVGTYSSIFVASPVLLFWSKTIKPINKEK
ncbi:MAG: protein translocase subunit SecF [Acidobacteria bacterium]|nr:MAG: protein translocase subunit SecF [Acidobacteriota bacterium]